MIGIPLAVWAIGALLLVALAGVGAYVYLDRRDADETDHAARDHARDAVATAREALAAVADALAGTPAKRRWWRVAGALVVVAAAIVASAAVAWLGWGPLSGGLFIAGLVAGAAAPPVAILMFRDGLPLGGLVGTGLAIAAQIAFGKAGLVRREDGQYEWGALREGSDGYYVALADGGRVDVEAEPGELFAFGFGKLAVSEAHGENLDRYRADTDASADTRAGFTIDAPEAEAGGIVVSLARIQRAIRGSASSDLVRRGRDKALDKAGGTGQLSPLWTMAFAAVLLVVGFAMTAGVMLL